MSSYFTCNSCGIAFTTSGGQRQHMKTEWHRYNLKRRVAQLPAVSEDDFNTKVATLTVNHDDDEEAPLSKREQRQKAKEELLEKKRQLLDLARRRIAGNGGRVTVGEDGKLIVEQRSTAEEEEKIREDIEKDEEVILGEDANLTEEQIEEKMIREKMENKVEIPSDTCIFCGKKSVDLDSNIEHMFKAHGLFIPEKKYLVDKAGLVEYLGEKVGYGNICLACNYQGRNLESIRQHMLAKSHCTIPYETEDAKLEIGTFYDFSSSYGQQHEEGEEDDEDDWEDVSDSDSGSQDGELIESDDVIYSSEVGLHLPNGMVAGHRSLNRIWRQNLPPERELGEGQGTVIAAETRHLATQFDRKQYKETKRVWAREMKARDMNDRRQAKFINVKPHYRDELLQ